MTNTVSDIKELFLEFRHSLISLSSLKLKPCFVRLKAHRFLRLIMKILLFTNLHLIDSTCIYSTEEKTDHLPADCGRFISFKYFIGNRTDIDDFPWLALLEYETRKYTLDKGFVCLFYIL